MSDLRPTKCRNRLRDEGKAYPKSGCAVCKTGGITGCPHEAPAAPPTGGRTASAWLNFYAKGNYSSHFTRETADWYAGELKTNPRIACIEVSAEIGEGL